jgi:hypothetical protein
MSEFYVTKPYLVQIFMQPTTVKISRVDFIQNVTQNRYVSVMVSVHNFGDSQTAGVAYVVLYDAEAREIGRGVTNSTILQPDQKLTLEIQIVWVPGAYLTDMATANVGFMPSGGETS